MPAANHEHAMLLYSAMASRFGIALPVNDYAAAAQALYKARTTLSDPELKILQFRRSPIDPDGELWIVRSKSDDARPLPTAGPG